MNLACFAIRNSVLVLLLTASFLSVSGSVVHAQEGDIGSADITFTLSNKNPNPGQQIEVSARSYSFDIDSATLVWSVNGKEVQKGIGLTELQVKAPALGGKIYITISAISPTGSRYSGSVSIGSGSVDMIMETDGYVPPFFKGKNLLAFQNTVTIIAMPHVANSSGKEYDPATLVYKWEKDDGTVLQDQSGYGKQSITLEGSLIPRPYYLIVTAISRDGSAQAQGMIAIKPSTPSIVFYREDPLYGPLFNRSINGPIRMSSQQKESRFFASLFGFNIPTQNEDPLSMTWMINGTKHPELSSSRTIVLRTPEESSGTSLIELTVRGAEKILQYTSSRFNVSFDTTKDKTSSTEVIL